MKRESNCKWGEKPTRLDASTAWVCTYKIPLSLVAQVGSVNYGRMVINECLCQPDKCRCYEPKEQKQFYWMFDNHTFEKLPCELDKAFERAVELFEKDPFGSLGYSHPEGNRLLVFGNGLGNKDEFMASLSTWYIMESQL